MPYKYFFGRKEISYNGRQISAGYGADVNSIKEKNVVVNATLVKNLVDNLCRLYQISPSEIVNIILNYISY